MEDLPKVHVFHAHYNVVVAIKKGTVKHDDVFRAAPVHDLKFSYNSFAHLALSFNMDDLRLKALDLLLLACLDVKRSDVG